MNSGPITQVDSLSYLGVTITKYLKWNHHNSNTCAKAKSKLGILYRHFNQADQSTLSSCTNRWCSHSWTAVAVCGTPHLLVLLISWNQFRSSEQDSVPNTGQTNTFLCYLDYHAIWPSLSSRRSRQKVTLHVPQNNQVNQYSSPQDSHSTRNRTLVITIMINHYSPPLPKHYLISHLFL